MSLFSIDFIRRFPQAMAIPGREAPVDWVQGGYLFIVPGEYVAMLEANFEVQRAHGCNVELLDPKGLAARFPSMHVDDLAAGVHTPDDGWCDPFQLLQGFKRKAIDLGVKYVVDEVVALEVAGGAVRTARLASGAAIAASHFVNAAGAWSARIGAMAGMPLPIAPLRRFEHYFTCGNPMEKLPYVKDVQRLAFRSEGKGFSGGLVDSNQARGFNFDVDHDYFERLVWPAAEYRLVAATAQSPASLEVRCTLKGPYPKLRSTLVELFASVPGFVLREMSMSRPTSGSIDVEAKLGMAVFLLDEAGGTVFVKASK